eukprot:TRINITY_DN4568_c0_g1_i1.p1 TRINITY_DN4568_c0_g1~~TRINITY_DN4568_c0_g1_i1.p1  ORF type:complete len:290 (-),score=92.01 TRINITY_DN4568_c0_g1_i1:280-1074(-)
MAASTLAIAAVAPSFLASGREVVASRHAPASLSFAVKGGFSRKAYNGNRTGAETALGYYVAFPRRAGSCRAASTEEVEMEKELIETDALEKMEKTLETVKSNFNTVRTGRASPSLLDRIEVEYYGTNVALRSIAQISTPDGSTIAVSPFDKSSLSAIEKAILKSDLGLTPSNDGQIIRISIPQLTADRRKALLKTVGKLSEEGKVALRNVRREAMKAYEKLEKEKKLSEDNVKDLSAGIQKMTDDYVKKVDVIFKQKEKELTTV